MDSRIPIHARRIEPVLDAKGRVIHWRCTSCRWTYPHVPGRVPFKAPPQALQNYGTHDCLEHLASDTHPVALAVDVLPHPQRRQVLRDPAFAAALRRLLDGSMAAVGASLGDVQLYDGSALELVAFNGFDGSFGTRFRYVRPEQDVTVSSTAFRTRRRAIARDLFADDSWEALRPAAEQYGFAAVTSTPLFQGGAVFGVVSTYFVTPGEPTAEQLHIKDGHLATAVPALLSLLRRR